jgi:hypothetical protein
VFDGLDAAQVHALADIAEIVLSRLHDPAAA